MLKLKVPGVIRMISDRINKLKEKIAKLKENRKAVTKLQVFKFSPFSIKQRKVLTWWCKDSPINDMHGVIADGSIRSGKIAIMSMSFV